MPAFLGQRQVLLKGREQGFLRKESREYRALQFWEDLTLTGEPQESLKRLE
jgi:hypothetical protein